jgi:protein involved in polysaccharide export with SLBB domain
MGLARLIWQVGLAGLLLAATSGCATLNRPRIQQSLKHAPAPASEAAAQAAYTIACPDVLRLVLPARPELDGLYAVGPDGRLDLGLAGQPRVEGATPAEAGRRIGELLRLPVDGVGVWVAEYRSRHVHLFGQVSGSPRSVPWQGPETVVEMLRRTGGLQAGAAVNEVHVVRSQVAEGRRPEVYRIDLKAILTRGDPSTDLRLEPFDQIYVGELRRSSLCRLLPPWLRPTFCRLCGLRNCPACECERAPVGRIGPVAADE